MDDLYVLCPTQGIALDRWKSRWDTLGSTDEEEVYSLHIAPLYWFSPRLARNWQEEERSL